jgi:hypothetical protein
MRSWFVAMGLTVLLFSSSLGQAPAEGTPLGNLGKPKGPKGPAHLVVQPYLAVNSGYTKYKMDVLGEVEGERVRLESELKFPMDVTVAGAKVAVELPDGQWQIEGEFWTSLKDPSKKMTDGDWITLGDRLMFSYTESDVTMSAYQFRIGLGYRAHAAPTWQLTIPAGFQFQKITQEVMGYDGWQLDSNFQRVTISGSEHAIHYEVKYNTCYAGLRAVINPVPQLQIKVEGDGCYFWVSDFDDHLLRGKTGTAEGTGSGGMGSLDLIYWFGQAGAKARPFIGLKAETIYLSSSMRQTQHWYRAEEGVEAGSSISGIPHKITTQQTRIGGSIGIRF